MNDLGFIEKEITVKGLKKEYRILHVTDFHIVLSDERDEGFVIDTDSHLNGTKLTDYSALRDKQFTYNGVKTYVLFSELCDKLRDNPDCADVIVFTGDILDFYTPLGFEFLREQLGKLRVPFMFVIGNHDMIFSKMSENDTREIYKELSGDNTYLQKMKLDELTLVGVYNGAYYYPKKSLCGLENALKGEKNVILFQHVPLPESEYNKFISEDEKSKVKESYRTVFEWITAEESPVKAVIAGDNHVESHYMIGDVAHHVSPLASKTAPVLFKIHP